MKLKGNTIVKDDKVILTCDNLTPIQWKELSTLIENADQMWMQIQQITNNPHISHVLTHLHAMEALRSKISQQLYERRKSVYTPIEEKISEIKTGI